jgi:hypothetical protein
MFLCGETVSDRYSGSAHLKKSVSIPDPKQEFPRKSLETYLLLQENEGDGGESQTEGDLSDLAELSVNGPGSVDVKKEIGVKGKIPQHLMI